MVILGIDPGYAIVGFGAVRYERGRFAPLGYGAVTTRAHTEFTSRLEEIYDGMTELYSQIPTRLHFGGKALLQYQHHHRHCGCRGEGCILLAAKKVLCRFTNIRRFRSNRR